MLIKPTNDYAFKSLFKRYPDILSYFLNAILEKEKIKIQNFLDPELPALIASKKQSFLDVLCSDEDGCRYIIEMQVAHQMTFTEKSAFVDESPIFGAAFNHLDKISQSEEESQFYEFAEKQERDRANIIYAQREKFKEALKETGKTDQDIENILNKIDDFPIENID